MRARAEVVPVLDLIEVFERVAGRVIEDGNWHVSDPTDAACLAGLIGAHIADDLAARGIICIGGGPLFVTCDDPVRRSAAA